ncbi:MAG: HypC/HybG/HupF family hydrogenase formation chaperone [Candidatus Zixiibacteriota bacterium]
MCLAIPGKVVEITEENGVQMGRIDYAGTVNTACLAYVPEVKVGQYVIVHAGFALSVIDEQEAARTLALFDEMVQKAAEEGQDVFGMPLDEQGGDKE